MSSILPSAGLVVTDRASVSTVDTNQSSTPNGDLDLFFASVYHELSRIASGRFSSATPTLDTAAIVAEAYAKLNRAQDDWKGPNHVRAVACRAMRQIVSNYLRDKKSLKRGGNEKAVQLDDALYASELNDTFGILDLDRGLKALEKLNLRQAQIVELRFFGGYDVQEVADILQIGTATVKRDWQAARVFLQKYLAEHSDKEPGDVQLENAGL